VSLDRIREAAARQIDKIIGEYVQLSRAGSEWRGICPFHTEQRPSLYVGDGVWYCHGCGAGGDAFTFVQKIEHCSFAEAVEIIARRVGIPLDRAQQAERVKAEGLERAVSLLYQELLQHIRTISAERGYSGQVQAYLCERRGILPNVVEQSLAVFSAPETLRVLEELKSKTPEGVWARSGLGATPPDFWRSRVIIPIVIRGRIVNMYARAVGESQKPHLYLASRARFPWGLDQARKRRTVVLTEAIIDAMSVLSALSPDDNLGVAALLGTNANEALVRRLRAFDKAIICFDCDKDSLAGQKAALKLAGMLSQNGITVEIADLASSGTPPPVDPNELLIKAGPEVLHECVLHPVSPLEFRQKWQVDPGKSLLVREGSIWRLTCGGGVVFEVQHIDTSDPRGLRAVVIARDGKRILNKSAVPLWSDVARSRFASKCAQNGIQRGDVEGWLLTLDEELQRLVADTEVVPSEEEHAATEVEIDPEDKEKALEWLTSPHLLQSLYGHLDLMGIVGEQTCALVTYLVMASRRMFKPLYLIIKGESSTGKSHILTTIAKLCPPDECRELSRMTAQALFRVPPDWAKHRFLILQERVGGEDADYSLRTMMSEEGLVLLETAKDETGNLVTQERVVEGPMAYAETTTAMQINFENETRLIELSPDDSPEQTERIHEYQRFLATEAGLEAEVFREEVMRLHHAAQRLLQPIAVVIPFAELLSFPTDKARFRRDHDKLLRLVRVVAFLHQHQREVQRLETPAGTKEYIEATPEDYEIVYDIADSLFASALQDLDERTARVFAAMTELARKRYIAAHPSLMEEPTPDQIAAVGLSLADIRPYARLRDSTLRRVLQYLVDIDYVNAEKRGRSLVYNVTYIDDGRGITDYLISPVELRRQLQAEALRE